MNRSISFLRLIFFTLLLFAAGCAGPLSDSGIHSSSVAPQSGQSSSEQESADSRSTDNTVGISGEGSSVQTAEASSAKANVNSPAVSSSQTTGRSAAPSAGSASSSDTLPAGTVLLTVIRDNGQVLLDSEPVSITAKSTVFTVTRDTLREKKLHIDFSGAGNTAYIRGIDNLYEKDKGDTSGWIYTVNDNPAKSRVSCGAVTVKPGDRIRWQYSLDMGKDIGVPQK